MRGKPDRLIGREYVRSLLSTQVPPTLASLGGGGISRGNSKEVKDRLLF